MRKIPLRSKRKTLPQTRTEFELIEEKGNTASETHVPNPLKMRSKKEKWGSEAFLDAGETTFGE